MLEIFYEFFKKQVFPGTDVLDEEYIERKRLLDENECGNTHNCPDFKFFLILFARKNKKTGILFRGGKMRDPGNEVVC